MSWTCPRCGRSFASESQVHSHDVGVVDSHFAGRSSELRAAFDAVVRSLPADVRVDSLTTAIILAARTTFAYVVVRRDRLLVGLFLERGLESPRVVRVEAISARKVASIIEVRRPEDVDNELCGWLCDAHRLRS